MHYSFIVLHLVGFYDSNITKIQINEEWWSEITSFFFFFFAFKSNLVCTLYTLWSTYYLKRKLDESWLIFLKRSLWSSVHVLHVSSDNPKSTRVIGISKLPLMCEWLMCLVMDWPKVTLSRVRSKRQIREASLNTNVFTEGGAREPSSNLRIKVIKL